jgi:hypothetical protein
MYRHSGALKPCSIWADTGLSTRKSPPAPNGGSGASNTPEARDGPRLAGGIGSEDRDAGSGRLAAVAAARAAARRSGPVYCGRWGRCSPGRWWAPRQPLVAAGGDGMCQTAGARPAMLVIASANASGSASSHMWLPGTMILGGSPRAARSDSLDACVITVSCWPHKTVTGSCRRFSSSSSAVRSALRARFATRQIARGCA